ncbi:acyl-CoA dehydrogenase [Nitriliruptoraceae bacterium ZYF776]|nr:acyl-CoA dehydrogenase [Profundirhabdus halotolerans]
MWEFETDPEFQKLLDWADEFVTAEVEPVDQLIDHAWDVRDPLRNRLIRPLQEQVRAQGLWATHLGPELGGQGYGQVKLGLLNEVLGRSHSAPVVFGCAAPDTGNAEILAHYGTDEQKRDWLQPLIDGDIVSCFSMTEPEGGSDPTGFATRATRDGDGWKLSGEKWFSSHASFSTFLIVLAVTDPEAEPHRRLSAFVLPTDTPGVEIVRNVTVGGHDEAEGTHAYIRYHDVALPADALLGEVGGGFEVAQVRLGGGRVHHAMRTVGLVQRAFEMMLERAVSRRTRGSRLADKQLVQAMIADTFVQIQQFRLLVLQTAWRIDRYQDYRAVRADIGAVKIAMPRLLHDVAARAIQIHGSLGVSTEMPFHTWLLESFHMGLADGATEVHQVNLARELLKGVEPAPDLFPSAHLPRLQAAARERFADVLDELGMPS